MNSPNRAKLKQPKLKSDLCQPSGQFAVSQRSIGVMVLLLLMALSFFFFKSQTINLSQHYDFVSQLRRLQELESTVKADVLKTRFAIDPNYDRLVLHGDQLRLNCARLKQASTIVIPRDRPQLHQQFRDVEAILENQAGLIERFKSQNAVLQNSLRYFPNIAQTTLNEFENTEVDPKLSSQLDELLASLLIYNLNAREELKSQIQVTIAQLEQLNLNQLEPVQARVSNILLHGKAILQLKADVATVMAEIINLPVAPTLDRFTAAYDTAQNRTLEQASFYRWFLYGNCLMLLSLVILLYRNRDRAKVLQTANANLERVVDSRTQTLRHTLQDLQQSQVQLIQAEKMAGLGQLVAGIAHEINNPVSFIYGNIAPARNYVSDMMKLIARYQLAYPQALPEIEAYLEEIDWEFAQTDLPRVLSSMQTGADRIREIVLSLRNFSRLDEADKKQADLNQGIESTLLLLQHRLKAQPDRPAIQIEPHLGNLPEILCYPGQINQVFMNLLVNAIDALEESLTGQPDRPLKIQIHTRFVSENVVSPRLQVEISDNGTGMSQEIQQKLFDPFFTTKPVGKGTGLGMSISYQIIVERHGGNIRCESVLGQGTQFIIELPIVPISN